MSRDVALLEREVYTEAEAARLLGMPQSTLHYWLEGGTRGRRSYLPIIREAASGGRVLTWGEFLEASLLRGYRDMKVPMVQLRRFIEYLRAEFGVPYPLAHEKPWVSGKELVRKAQDASGLGIDYWLVTDEQLLLTFAAETFVRRVTWDSQQGVAARYRPHSEQDSPIIIDPLIRFGRPSVRGVSTEAIVDEVESGASWSEAAEDFGLDVSDVRWAIAYEATRAA